MATSEPRHQVLSQAAGAEQGIAAAVNDAGDSGSKTKLCLLFYFQIVISTLSCASCLALLPVATHINLGVSDKCHLSSNNPICSYGGGASLSLSCRGTLTQSYVLQQGDI